MRSTSIFIPVLLIVCLGALVYLFFAALRAAGDDRDRDQGAIVLNAEDYQSEDGGTYDPATGEIPPADTGLFEEVRAGGSELVDELGARGSAAAEAAAGYGERLGDKAAAAAAATQEAARAAGSAVTDAAGDAADAAREATTGYASTATLDDNTPARARTEDSYPSTTPERSATAPSASATTSAPAGGRYLVIAGTFTQLAGARARVAALKSAGFTNARVEKFNRGKYAVALAGQYDGYRTASGVSNRLREQGFEARVMQRR